MVELYALKDIPHEIQEVVGGKMWRLGMAASRGLPVPDGLAVPHDTAVRCIADEAVWRRCFAQIVEYFGHFPLKLAVRSSSNFEDSTSASGAGIFESVIGVAGEKEIFQAVSRCLLALHTPTARHYAGKTGKGREQAVRMNVIVQKLIAARRSGVAITDRPQPGQFMAEGAWGLALDIVSGIVNPDFIVGRIGTGEVVFERKGQQDSVCVPNDEGQGVVRRKIGMEECGRRIFDRDLAVQLSSLAEQVGKIFGPDQEIEWAEDGRGKLWLIQTRPFTSRQAYRKV